LPGGGEFGLSENPNRKLEQNVGIRASGDLLMVRPAKIVTPAGQLELRSETAAS
jgi:hypothetical protein